VAHSEHKTVKLAWPFGDKPEKIAIDEKLAPLIRLLWAEEIYTCQCCEEYNPGTACIEFPGTIEAMEFLAVAQREYKVELETWNEGKDDGKLSIVVRLLVLFPTGDIPYLVKAFMTAQSDEQN